MAQYIFNVRAGRWGMGAAKNSEICAKMIVHKNYSVFSAAFEIGDFIATAGGSSAAGLLEGTKAQEVIDKFFSFRNTNSRPETW